MRLEAFRTELPRAFDGDLAAPHPRDRRFRALLADVPGMATESKLALLSLAAAHLEPGEAYLEVGSFKGLSLIGALLGNLDRWVDRERLRLLEGDCFRLLRRERLLEAPVGVYFYDGAHGRLPHYLALGVAEPWLADRALVVVDDASWPMVARATEREEDPRWWNGLRVYAFRRPPGQAAGRRASPDVAWRMLAYGLAYQPAVRLAWKTLPHHPRLASAVLKVVPMASRRVPGCG